MSKYIPFAAGHATLSEKLLGPVNGQILIRKINCTSDKAGSMLRFYPAKQQTTVRATSAAGATNLYISAPLAVVDGAVLTTSDYVIVLTAGGVFMDLIAAVDATEGAEKLTLTSNIPSGKGGAVGDKVFIVRAADLASVACGAASLSLEFQSAGFDRNPIGIRLDSTSAGYLSGLAEVLP